MSLCLYLNDDSLSDGLILYTLSYGVGVRRIRSIRPEGNDRIDKLCDLSRTGAVPELTITNSYSGVIDLDILSTGVIDLLEMPTGVLDLLEILRGILRSLRGLNKLELFDVDRMYVLWSMGDTGPSSSSSSSSQSYSKLNSRSTRRKIGDIDLDRGVCVSRVNINLGRLGTGLSTSSKRL